MLAIIIVFIVFCIVVSLFYFGSRKIDSIEKEIKETKTNRVKHKIVKNECRF